MTIDITFWGVRGSVPTPLTPTQIKAKVQACLEKVRDGIPLDFEDESTYGGNTTCVEVRANGKLFILDMGTGVRELGKQQMKEVFSTKKLQGTILQSHVHWDHIQGVPFWAPLYLPRRKFNCHFDFFGGKSWDSKLDAVYRGQMNPPVFPVNLEALEHTAMNMTFESIYDGWGNSFRDPNDLTDPGVKVLARTLWHPGETFGYRIEAGGVSMAFTTDHEPFADGIPDGLAELVQGVDVWVTDVQYTHDDYIGKNGPKRQGWGHSYPEYIARVAKECNPKMVVTTHHDPDSSDMKIRDIARQVQEMAGITTMPAYEGFTVSV